MDDIPMMDESPESTPQQQRFNIADVLGATSHSDSSSFFSDMAEPDERIVRDRLRALYPYLDEKKHALPRHWSTSDRHQTLSISSDFLRVRNRGKGKEQKDAAAVRSDRPIPRACGLYYFEITVVTKPHSRPGIKKDERLLGVGLCEKNVGTNRLPGWDQTSYGYHGDDGHFFCSSGQGREYGPTFDIGDTIGCGISFVTREIFFTRNGQHLGVAKRDVNITQDLYPVVGMQSPDEMVDANFGQKPFAYDIKKEMEAVAQSAIESVNEVQLPPQKSIWMSRAVSAWMAHEGYVRALEAFNSATLQVEKESRESIENRRAIIKLVQSGKMGDAIAKTEQCYPTVFKNKQLLLMLKIQQFVEMLRDVSQEAMVSPSDASTSSSVRDVVGASPNGMHFSSSGSSPQTTHASSSRGKRSATDQGARNAIKRRSNEDFHDSPAEGRRQSPRRATLRSAAHAASVAPMESQNGNSHNGVHRQTNSEPMEVVTDGLLVTNGNSTNGCVVGTPPTSTTIIAEEEDADDAFDANMDENGDAQNNLQEYEKYLPVIEFGQSVATLSNQMGSAPKKLLNRMNDAFCLICHSNLLESSKAYLLDHSQRTIAAKALNSAILQNIAREASPMSDELKSSPLDDLFRRAHFSRERAMNVSAAGAAFVTADRICFDSTPDISQGAPPPTALSC